MAAFAILFSFVGVPVAAVGLAAWLGGMYGLSRSIYTGVANRRGYKLRDLADRLAQLVKDLGR